MLHVYMMYSQVCWQFPLPQEAQKSINVGHKNLYFVFQRTKERLSNVMKSPVPAVFSKFIHLLLLHVKL